MYVCARDSLMTRKTILCAFDFSESSIKALRWAMEEAQMQQAEVIFLFCYRLIAPSDEGISMNMKSQMEAKALVQFQEIETKFIGRTSITYQFVTEVGFFPSRIELFIRKSPVSLLVMGSSIIEDFNEYKNITFDQFLLSSQVPVVVVAETETSPLTV